MNLLSSPLRDGEIKILNALKDGQPRSFSDLKEATGLSGTSISDNLDLLQRKRMVKRNIDSRMRKDSRKYVINPAGLSVLKRNDLADTIRNSSANVETQISLPVDSIVAIDIPKLSETQQQIVMHGTMGVARACFNQFLMDMRKAKGSEEYPAAGRIVYTASIDLKKAKDWLDSAEGKNYKVTSSDEDS